MYENLMNWHRWQIALEQFESNLLFELNSANKMDTTGDVWLETSLLFVENITITSEACYWR